jgi:hypothetical protein
MALVTSQEAADRLGISVRQVQRLARAGELKGVGPNRFEWNSVIRRQGVRQNHHRRAWTEATAWAAVAILGRGDVKADWLGQAQRSRLKSQLREVTSRDLIARARNRATVHRLTGHRSVAARVAAEVVVSGSSRSVGELTAASVDQVDGYVDHAGYEALVSRFTLSAAEAGTGNVILRATGFSLDVVEALADQSDVLGGLDLAESLDAREQSTGLAVLDEALGRLR